MVRADFADLHDGKFDVEKCTRAAEERTSFPGRAAAISPKQRVRDLFEKIQINITLNRARAREAAPLEAREGYIVLTELFFSADRRLKRSRLSGERSWT